MCELKKEGLDFKAKTCPKGFGFKVAKLRLKTPSKISKLNKRFWRGSGEVRSSYKGGKRTNRQKEET